MSRCVTCACAPAHTSRHRPRRRPAGRRSSVDVVELSAADAQARLAAGTLTSRALTQAYLDRIAAIDDAGPRLNAVIEINPDGADAGRRARRRARRPARCAARCTASRCCSRTTSTWPAWSTPPARWRWPTHRPKQDAFLVRRLRDAGAVILGKTNLSEWANFRSTRSSSGWSSRGGQTRNPYVLDRNPCGSSSGTGAAIAASLAMAGVGTETDGSIICPASVNGLVGLKPTVGLVSRSGIIPIAVSQDTAGPMARTVADVALLMTALAAVDRRDPAGRGRQGHVADYTAGSEAGRAEGQALRRAAPVDGLSPGRGRVDGGRHQGADGGGRRGGRRDDRQRRPVERPRDRGAALRVQGRAERVPEEQRRAARARSRR